MGRATTAVRLLEQDIDIFVCKQVRLGTEVHRPLAVVNGDITFNEKSLGRFDDEDSREPLLIEVMTERAQRVFIPDTVSTCMI
jgi:hypothetical protein